MPIKPDTLDDPYVWRDAFEERENTRWWVVVASEWRDRAHAAQDELTAVTRNRGYLRGLAVHHIDGDPLNNDPGNLRIVDPKANRGE